MGDSFDERNQIICPRRDSRNYRHHQKRRQEPNGKAGCIGTNDQKLDKRLSDKPHRYSLDAALILNGYLTNNCGQPVNFGRGNHGLHGYCIEILQIHLTTDTGADKMMPLNRDRDPE